MGIDTSIYSNLLRPPKSVAEYDQEAMEGQQNRLMLQMNRAKMAEQERGIERGNRLTSMLGGFKPGMSAADQGDQLTRGGFIDEGRKVIESGAKANADERAAEKAEIESNFKKFELAGQIMGGVKDQATWDRARQQTAQFFGPDAAAQMPAQYDPELVEQKRMQGMGAKDQLEQVWKQKGYDLDVRQQGEVERNNRVQAADRDATRAQSSQQHNERLAFDKSKQDGDVGPSGAKGGKAPAGYRWTAAGDLEAIPGGPAGNKATSSEGERKAATLLQRLEFSEKQLEDAVTKRPGAAKPDLLANGLRGMGMEAIANTTTGSERQRVDAAQLDILDAALTLGTGAAYTREQLEGYRKSYFPQIGDTPDNVADKQARLKNVIDAAKTQAGRSAPKAKAPPIRVQNDADYAKVPSGAEFITPDGKTRRKP